MALASAAANWVCRHNLCRDEALVNLPRWTLRARPCCPTPHRSTGAAGRDFSKEGTKSEQKSRRTICCSRIDFGSEHFESQNFYCRSLDFPRYPMISQIHPWASVIALGGTVDDAAGPPLADRK